MSKQSEQRFQKELEKASGTRLGSDYKVSDVNRDKTSNKSSNSTSNRSSGNKER